MSFMSHDATGYFLMAVVIAILVWDLFAYRKSQEFSVTSWIRGMSRDWPLIPFLVGFIAGHLFFP